MSLSRYARYAAHLTATIGSGTSLAPALDLSDYALSAIIMPAAWDAAAITFTASATLLGTYNPVYGDDGTEVSVASANAVAGRVIVNKAVLEQLAGLRYVKFRSGTSGTPVNQTADRAFTLMVKS